MTKGTRNVLWIMCDQMRHDYLGCAGHPHIKTPALDSLARDGVRFDSAFAQSTICGASRMSAYTGRYVRNHGASGNEVPLRVGETTLGDHLASIGADAVLVGKTHVRADEPGLARLGVAGASDIGIRLREAGFLPFERHDGLHPDGDYDPDPTYNDYLRAKGFDADNPWEAYANGAIDENGAFVSGWFMENAHRPARVPKEHSETAWITDRAIDFIAERASGDRPWCLHLSYIKPHWPYLAPDPYHAMYDASQVAAANRSEDERANPHPLYAAFMQERYSTAFSRDEVRDRVVPAYMGLISEVDDNLGRLFAFLRERELWDDTLIVFTSDHGDYLGDHWLGEKYLFHDPSVRIPMIVRDPRPAAAATRGSVSSDLVEMIDLLPTFLDFIAGHPVSQERLHQLDGRSLLPLLEGRQPDGWRSHVFSEYDYAYDGARLRVGTPVDDSSATMLFDGRWKYIHVPDHPPMLFDLQNDPLERRDLGRDGGYEDILAGMHKQMFDWCRKQSNRTTVAREAIATAAEASAAYDAVIEANILIGYWHRGDLAEEQAKRADFVARHPSRTHGAQGQTT